MRQLLLCDLVEGEGSFLFSLLCDVLWCGVRLLGCFWPAPPLVRGQVKDGSILSMRWCHQTAVRCREHEQGDSGASEVRR